MLEICKTRTKKSNADLLKFYVISNGHNMANDAGRATTCRRNFKDPWLQTDCTKNEGSSEKMSFNGETVWRFQTKKIQKLHSYHGEQNKRTTRARRQKLNMNHVATKNLAGAKLKKAFRIQLLEHCKTRIKKSNPDLLTFYVISGGHDMANDAGRATTCRRNFKAPWLQSKGTKMKGLLKKWNSTRKQFENFKRKKNQKKSSHRMENKTKEPRDSECKNWTWIM